MHPFTDSKDRQWAVSINVANQGAVERATGVSLLKLLDEKAQPLADLLADPALLATVVYWLCKREADARQVDDYGFAEALSGDTITGMRDAFLGALTDFFPDARRRALMGKMIESGKKTEALAMDLLDREAAKLNTDDLAQSALTTILNEASGKLPEALALTPAP